MRVRVSREEVGDLDRTQAMLDLGRVPHTPPHLPHPINEGSKDTQGTQTATEMDVCEILAHVPHTFLPSSWEMKERAGGGGADSECPLTRTLPAGPWLATVTPSHMSSIM